MWTVLLQPAIALRSETGRQLPVYPAKADDATGLITPELNTSSMRSFSFDG